MLDSLAAADVPSTWCAHALARARTADTPRGSRMGRNSRWPFVLASRFPRRLPSEVGASAPTAAFIGRGARLGGAGGGDASEGEGASNVSGGLFGFGVGGGIRNTSNRSSTSTDGGNKKDELTDRREKARQAALARMERNAGATNSAGVGDENSKSR